MDFKIFCCISEVDWLLCLWLWWHQISEEFGFTLWKAVMPLVAWLWRCSISHWRVWLWQSLPLWSDVRNDLQERENCKRRGFYLKMKSGLAMNLVMNTPNIPGPMAWDLSGIPGFEKEIAYVILIKWNVQNLLCLVAGIKQWHWRGTSSAAIFIFPAASAGTV